MRTLAIVAALGLAAALVIGGAEAGEKTGGKGGTVPVKPDAAKAPAPKVEVAFVLDTTGSMSGLIAGAKAKIWFIANQIVTGKPTPVVRMALVAYRDKGDTYVTKVFDLSDNIDQVYKDLMGFEAAGGGDRPENVNQALHDAVHRLQWSDEPKTLKIIYLVGDSPPHNEYKDVPTYDKTAAAAIKKGIYINTVLCGPNPDTGEIWREIARAAEGTFVAIAQSGGVQEIATPYDKDLSRLNAELSATSVYYGKAEVQRKQRELGKIAAAMPATSAAERASYAARSGKAASDELVDAVRDKKVDLDKLPAEELPEEMKKMTPAERKEHVARLQARREEIYKQITDLTAKRDKFVKEELAKTKGAKDSFDGKVMESLKSQAAKVGIEYK